MDLSLTLKPIGLLRTSYPDKFGVPRQPGLAPSAWGELVIEREWQPENALQGLQRFSHVWLIFGFHLNSNEGYRPKVHPPRLKGQSMGVFATRSPHRPNPIGLSLVRLEKVDSDRILVSGPDLVDGTPIYDIKPYLPHVESRSDAVAGWAQDVEDDRVSVLWTDQAEAELQNWQSSSQVQGIDLRALIEETISLDPRPYIYRGYEGSMDPKYRQVHAVRIETGDVHFEFIDNKTARVVKVLREFGVGPSNR